VSAIVTVRKNTGLVYDDWFLPSRDEWVEIYDEIVLYSLGGFLGTWYWSSSEVDANNATDITINNGVFHTTDKGTGSVVRACRAFTSTTVYNLRDIGPSDGLIFWNSGNNYLELYPYDKGPQAWSNIISVGIGTTGTAIGTGQANTNAIVGQLGHIYSAAKICDDL
jgi:hypothetical protein